MGASPCDWPLPSRAPQERYKGSCGRRGRQGGRRIGARLYLLTMADSQAPRERPESSGETQTIMELYARSEQATGRPQRAIERFTQAVGRPRTLFALLAFVRPRGSDGA